MAVDIEKVHEIIRAGFELDEEFSEVQDPAVRRELITKYIKKAEDHHAVSVPDFEPGNFVVVKYMGMPQWQC